MKLMKADAPPKASAECSEPAAVVRRELTLVESKLTRLLESREPIITEICRYLIDGAGKRLRPLFILLIYRACGGVEANVEDAVDAAIALELIHSATLLHDDIIDGGMLRRGKPSAFARYGVAASLVAGDFLFCRAFELCGRFDERLVRTAAGACIQLTEGEVMEGRLRHQAHGSFDDYLAVISQKTASLFAAGGRVAADLAGANAVTIETMERFGLAVGRAFQMVDDILDVTGPEELIGKPVGSDLREGVLSLPIVIGLQERPELKSMLRDGGPPDEAALASALAIVREPQVIRSARAKASEQVAIAAGLLCSVADSAYKAAIAELLAAQTERVS